MLIADLELQASPASQTNACLDHISTISSWHQCNNSIANSAFLEYITLSYQVWLYGPI